MKKFIAFVPFLVSYEGHEYSYYKALHEVVAKLGVPYRLYFSKKASPINRPKEWKKSLPKKWLFLSLEMCRILLFRRKPCHFFLEVHRENHLKAMAYAGFLFGRKNDTFWLVVRDVWEACKISEKRALRFISLLKKRSHVLHLTDSEKFLPLFEDNVKDKAHLLPVLFLNQNDSFLTAKNEKIGCLFHGKPKKSKGAHIVSKLLEINDLESKHFELTFSFSLPRSENQNLNGLTLKCFDPGMPKEKYLTVLHENAILLFPYLPKIYKNRTSGIFVEAIFFGKMVVVHEGTWLADELRKYDLTDLIVDWENDQFFSHLKTLYENESIWLKLKKMQKSYQQIHSMDGLKEKLFPLLTDNKNEL